MSSRGEMKMSLKLITCTDEFMHIHIRVDCRTYILMLQMFEQLQLPVGSL